MPKNNTQILLRCTEKQKEQLTALAKVENCSTVELARRALDAYFEGGKVSRRKQVSQVAYQMHKMHEDFRSLERAVLELNKL